MDDSDVELAPLLWSDAKARPVWKRVLLLAGAAVFLALGVVGWLIPIVTGVPFYIVGFALLGAGSPRAARALNRAEAHLPHRWRVGLRRVLAKLRRSPESEADGAAQSSPRARSSSIVSDNTRSNGCAVQPSSERALDASKRK